VSEATANEEPGGGTAGEGPEYSDIDAGPEPAAPSAFESLVNAMLEAGPEVAEHLVRSAQELLLAAQTVVDAAQRAVEEQQTVRRPHADAARHDPAADGGGEPAPGATVHHLDVSE
jgi:hypothetical protein